MKKEETAEQIAVVQFCDTKGWFIIHIPNEGKRSPRTGMILKQMGLRPGCPDLFLTEPSGRWHGLFIEMKSEDGRVSNAQKECLEKLNKKGYAVKIAYSATEAILAIERYMDLGGKQNQ